MSSTPAFYDHDRVAALLDYRGCTMAVRQAMIELSTGGSAQPLRQVVDIDAGRKFGVMPGSLGDGFGAKLISVFEDSARPGRSRHRGVVVAFDRATGQIECIADAEAVTTIRTGCASAAASDALARADAETLVVYGTGTQAESHIRALNLVRPLRRIIVWGRSVERAEALAARLSPELGIAIEGIADGRAAAAEADIICTVSSASRPILFRDWVRPGTHINLVGSSYPGPVEIDTALVAAGRYFADYRPSVLAQAAEFLVAREAGAVDESHVVGEIGQVFAGDLAGRRTAEEITIYKSLGHVVQDLAAVAYLHARAKA